jgi:hypothetical protein
MTEIKSLRFKVIATAILGLSLIGCGGGGGSSAGDTTTNTGIFVDSPVEGLKYSTSTLSGFTNNKGEFQYKTGEEVKFSIGNLALGSAKGGELMTPLTLTGESDLNNISSKATNIARILQSLDENSSSKGQIKIPIALKDLDFSDIDLESEADLNSALAKAQSITSKSYILKDSINAKNEMKSYVNLFQTYKSIENKQYIGEGTKFYLLNLEEKRKIDFSFSRYASNGASLTTATLYDKNLIELNSSIRGVVELEADSYIVKLKIKDSSFWHHHEDAYIDVYLHNTIDDLKTLETKKYTGHQTIFYKLKLDTSKQINFAWYASSIKIFDKNLNDLNYSIVNDEIMTLPKGEYIIKMSLTHTYYNYTVKNGYVDVSIF